MQDVWDKRYQETEHLYGAEPNVFIQEINQRYPISGHTLAIAEGEGRNILYIARSAQKKHLPIDVEMWDYSRVALENAQSYAQTQGIELKLAVLIWHMSAGLKMNMTISYVYLVILILIPA